MRLVQAQSSDYQDFKCIHTLLLLATRDHADATASTTWETTAETSPSSAGMGREERQLETNPRNLDSSSDPGLICSGPGSNENPKGMTVETKQWSLGPLSPTQKVTLVDPTLRNSKLITENCPPLWEKWVGVHEGPNHTSNPSLIAVVYNFSAGPEVCKSESSQWWEQQLKLPPMYLISRRTLMQSCTTW